MNFLLMCNFAIPALKSLDSIKLIKKSNTSCKTSLLFLSLENPTALIKKVKHFHKFQQKLFTQN